MKIWEITLSAWKNRNTEDKIIIYAKDYISALATLQKKLKATIGEVTPNGNGYDVELLDENFDAKIKEAVDFVESHRHIVWK